MTPPSQPRFLQALAGVRVDPPPIWLMRQAGRYLPEYRATRAEAGSFVDLCLNPKLAAEVTFQPIRRYGLDAAILFSDILMAPYALGRRLDFVEGEGPQLDPIRPEGRLPRYDRAEFLSRLGPTFDAVAAIRAGLGPETPLIGFAGAPWTVASYMAEGGSSRDFLAAKRWAYEDPAGFQGLIDLLVEATADQLSGQVAAGAQALQLFDSWAGALSEPEARRWSIAPTRALVAELRRRHPSVPVIGFPRGLGALVPDYVAETGVQAVSLDSSMPLGWIDAALPSGLPVQGNLDPILLVAGGTALDDEADRIVAAFAGRPHVLNLGHGIVPQTPPDHVAQLVARVRSGRAAAAR